MTTPKVIDSFSDGPHGQYRFLSNFYPAHVPWGGHNFPTVEHAYQWCKTDDPQEQEPIRAAATPSRAKALGRRVTLRPDWDYIKLAIMHSLVRLKFMSNPELGQRLVNTGEAVLVEGNTWGDTYWGVCGGKGDNWLGVILMLTRSAMWRM